MTSSLSSSPLAFEMFTAGAIQLVQQGAGTSGRLQAFVRGVPLGAPVEFSSEDSRILVPVERFPHVEFPAEVRISWADGQDAVTPIRVDGANVVAGLVGQGTLSEVSVQFRNGLIVGTARNRANGVTVPMLMGRVNGTLLRAVETRLSGADDTGGASFRFTLPVEASDFSDRGASFEILHAPSLECIWRSVLAPADTLMGGGIVTDIRLSEAERKLADASLAFETKLNAKVARQNRLIEDLTAHLLSLIGKDADAREQARRLISDTAREEPADTTVGVVGTLSPYMGWGWSDAGLSADRIEQRRMGAAATVLNPHPDRPVKAIAVSVTEASPEALAALRGQTDGREAAVELPKVGGAPCTVTVRPQDGSSVSLVSLSCTAPRGGIAVQDIRFFYA